MKIGRLARPLAGAAIATLMLAGTAPRAGAQSHDDHDAAMASRPHKLNSQENALVQAVRNATERFKNVAQASHEGYSLLFGCVSGGDFGAMGLHFTNGSLVFDGGEVDITRPEIVLYEPTPNGGVRITGADYVAVKADWDPKHSNPDGSVNTPQLFGQLFHLIDAPNRFGLPAFYTLHVWAWKENPNGTFTNWNPNVSCDAFNDSTSK